MPLSHRSYGTARVVALRGRLDHDNCEGFQADLSGQLEACMQDGAALVLDLSGLEYVSSAGRRCLMISAKQTVGPSSRIVVSDPHPGVAGFLQISRSNPVLPLLGTPRAALA